MARIRSIKPEFGTDGKILRLSDSTALFFVLLWTHCDDFGFFTLDTLELSMKVGRWRSQDMMKMLRALHGQGLIRASSSDGVGMVVGWNHQKIKDRRVSKWNESQIKWEDGFSDAPKSEKNRPRSDLIGSDLIGSDLIGDKAKQSRRKPAASAPLKSVGNTVVSEYFLGWDSRYHGRAPLMGQDLKKLKRLGEDLGEKNAVEHVRAYFTMNTPWFLTKRHDVQTLMSNLSQVQHFISTGSVITTKDAQSAESGDSLKNQIARLTQVQP